MSCSSRASAAVNCVAEAWAVVLGSASLVGGRVRPAPRAGAVPCLDASDKVVAVGGEGLKHVANLRFVQGDMHELPFAAASFDAALLMSALDYAADPARVLAEVARVLAPGGAVVGATLGAHRHEAVVAAYNHVQLGFQPDALRAMLEGAGFRVELCATTSRERRPPHFEVDTFPDVMT